MKTTDEEQELTRWLDGEMNAADLARFEARLQADPALREEAEAMKAMCTQVKEHFPRVADVPHADFFNSQIQERIKEMKRAGLQQPVQAVSWLQWLRQPWVALAGAAALLLITGLTFMQTSVQGDASTVVLSTYAPNTGIKPRTYHDGNANATVLVLEGLEAIPADSKVVGYKVHHSETDQQVAMTTLFSDTGDVLLVLATDAHNQPRMIAH